jgi:hypothetical protein
MTQQLAELPVDFPDLTGGRIMDQDGVAQGVQDRPATRFIRLGGGCGIF